MEKQVNKNSKSLLAKCMATENIRVEHKRDAETAYFDTKNRLLVLPIWKDMSESIYDMLVAHEVSHALNTPAEGWEQAITGVKNKGAFHQFVNVVEDARIERMIKDKFPGIRRDFARAYQQLHDRDLFELAGKDVSEMSLLDRLNLEFKLGLFGHIQVPFDANEKQYVTRMAETVTFDEVVQLAKDLYDLWNDEQEAQQDDDGSSKGESQDGSESGEEQGNQGQSGDDQGESQDGSQSGSESEDGDEDGSQSGDGDSDEEGEDSGQSQTDDTDDGESADSEDGESEGNQGNDQSGMNYDDYDEGGLPSQTQQSLDNNLNQMVDKNSQTDYKYHTLPLRMNLDSAIVDYHKIKSFWDKHDAEEERIDRHSRDSYIRYREENLQQCQQFLNSSKRIVQHMVQQFMMRQAADADKRTDIAKTGILDTTTMINYRWSEDIFLKNETHTDGKNHGMVFFLDWSGSMNSILKDTVEQLLLLTEFCNKASIPFEVYAFTSKAINSWVYEGDGRWTTNTDVSYADYAENATGQLEPHSFGLLNFLSSKMKKAEYTEAVRNLYRAAVNNYRVPRELSTGCTPLNEAILCALDIVPAFQAENGVQIVNSVFLTDGEGHSMGAYGGYNTKAIVHDPRSRKDYEVSNDGRYNQCETDAYLRILKDRTGCNVIGIRILEQKTVKNIRGGLINYDDMESAVKSYRKNNYCVASANCSDYDEYFIIQAHQDATEDLFESLDDDMSHARLTNAFKKGTNNVKSNRVIATKMIEIFATN